MWADLVWAARAVAASPAVLLVSLALMGEPALTSMIDATFGHLGAKVLTVPLSLAFLVFNLGWFGSERIFFLHRLEGRPVTLRHLLRLVRPFCGRFAGLAFFVGAPIVGAIVLVEFAIKGDGGPAKLWLYWIFGLVTVAVDFGLTFVTPALAYTTPSAAEAMSIGAAMIRETWPRCMLYVLCPPLALNLGILIAPTENPWVDLAATIVLVTFGLVAKGAIAAFYLRERGSRGEDGAAYVPLEDRGMARATRPDPEQA
jgi:hypothetical protein